MNSDQQLDSFQHLTHDMVNCLIGVQTLLQEEVDACQIAGADTYASRHVAAIGHINSLLGRASHAGSPTMEQLKRWETSGKTWDGKPLETIPTTRL